MSSVTTTSIPTRLSAEERREQIILAATAAFGARGYDGTTTDDVARAAGVSQPYVVRLFGSKEKLFLGALGDALDRLVATFREAIAATGPGEERARAIGDAYVDLLRRRGLHQILSQSFLLGSHPVIGPAARDGFASIWRLLREEAGMDTQAADLFLAQGMLINTLLGLRITDQYGEHSGMTEVLDKCFPHSIDAVLEGAPRGDDPW